MENKIEDFPLILLVGGRSARMGTPKGLLDYQGHPWLLEQLTRFEAVSGKLAVIVLGYHHELYFEKIPWLMAAGHTPSHQLGLEISVVVNPTREKGQFSSIQCAIPLLQTKHLGSEKDPIAPSPQPSPARGEGKRLTSSPLMGEDEGGGGFKRDFYSKNIPGVFILPVDVPCTGKEVFEKLVGSFNKTIDAVIPRYQFKGGHPVLLSTSFLRRLAEVSPASPEARLDLQIRTLPMERITFVSVNDKNICLNINSLDEFQEYTKREDGSGRT